jgi:hypothetical protein
MSSQGDCGQSPLAKQIQLEVEYDSRLVLETVLTAARGVVEASVKIIDLGRPERDCTRMVYCDVHASASREGKGIAGGSLGKHSTRYRRQVTVHVAVRSAQEDLAVRPDFPGSDPKLRTKQIGEEVALDIRTAAQRANRTSWSGSKPLRVAAIALEVHLDAKMLGEVEVNRATSPVETIAAGVGVAGGITSIAVVCRHLNLREILGQSAQPKKQNSGEYN